MDRLKSFLVCLGISAFFIYGFGIQGLQEQESRSKWPKYEAKVIKPIVKTGHHQEGSANSSLFLEMEVDVDGKKRILRRHKIEGDEARLKKMAAEEFKPGTVVSLHINPDNPKETLFEVHHGLGPYLLGFLPGLFFLIIGINALRTKKTIT